MSKEYIPVIGIEIHVELKTKSKMFSSAPVSYGEEVNSQVNIFDLAFPGTLPTVNKQAVNFGIQISKALNMDISKVLTFDRKNYFYPDLPKGYQITQQDNPIGSDGYVDITLDDGTIKRIGVERAHLEEDTAKQLHFPDYTLLNYNRAGTPLVEIVSKPDIRSSAEAGKYVEMIKQIVTFLGVSDGKMEEGSMRCDVNISLMEKGSSKFGTKVECKNLNSIANVRSAVEYEIARQTDLLNRGLVVEQETRRYNDSKSCTVLMRKKTDAVDYKYFKEPNISPIGLSDTFINECIESMNMLPWDYRIKYQNLGLSNYEIGELLLSKENVDFFDEVMGYNVDNIKILWNYLMGDILSYTNKNEISLSTLEISKEALSNLCNIVNSQTISYNQGKEVLKELINGKKDVKRIIKNLGLEQVNDDKEILDIVIKVLDENEKSISDYLNGKDKAFGFILGQIMKSSGGKVNPNKAKEFALQEIEKRK